MDDFLQTAAEEYFADTSVVLAGGRYQQENSSWVSTEVDLHVNFGFLDSTVRVSVYDSEKHQYLAEYAGENFTEIEGVFRVAEEVANSEGNKEALKVFPELRKKISEFLHYAPDAFSVFSDLAENPDWDSRYCETCGISSDELSAYVFPATDKFPASVSLHWEYGCYGGTEIVGVFSEKKDELINVLNIAIKSADGAPEGLFREFLQKVENFQP